MHGAQIFPRFSVRKVLRAESKMNWVLQVHFALPPTVPPCDVTARLWQPPRLVGSRCSDAYVRPSCVRPQQPSPPPLFGNRVPWSCTPRPAAALAAGASRYPPPPPPTESCAQWQLHAPWASCFSAAARTPLVGSGFPRRSAQKSDQLNAGRFGSLSLWQFANYVQIIQRVPSGDDQARRQAGGA